VPLPSRSIGQFTFFHDGSDVWDLSAFRHLCDIDTATSMALQPTGLVVMLVVDTNNRDFRRIENANGGQRDDIYQQLAIAGDEHDFSFGLGKGQAEAHGDRSPHRTGKRKGLCTIGANHTQNIVFAAGKTRDKQRAAGIPNQRLDSMAAFEDAFGNGFIQPEP